MAATIASLHLLAVVGVALWTKSRLLTWLAAIGVLAIAFSVGASGYGVMDAISTLLGLAIGLNLIGDQPKAAQPATPPSVVAPGPDVTSQAPLEPARMFQLHPSQRTSTAPGLAKLVGYGVLLFCGIALLVVYW